MPDLEAGRELDVLVAEVLGWKWWKAHPDGKRALFPANYFTARDIERHHWIEASGTEEIADFRVKAFSAFDDHALHALKEWRGQDKAARAWSIESSSSYTVECTEIDTTGDYIMRSSASAKSLPHAASLALARTKNND